MAEDAIATGRLVGCPPLPELATRLGTAGVPVVEGRYALRCGDLVLRTDPDRPEEIEVTGDHGETRALVAQAARLSQALGTAGIGHAIDVFGPDGTLSAAFPAGIEEAGTKPRR